MSTIMMIRDDFVDADDRGAVLIQMVVGGRKDNKGSKTVCCGRVCLEEGNENP